MAFLKPTFVSLTLIVLLSTAVIINAADNAFCSLADDKVLCDQMAKNAKDWNSAMTNTLQASLAIAEHAKSIPDQIGAHMPAQLKPVSKESLDSTCRETFDNIIFNLEGSLKFVKTNDFGGLKTYLSAVSFDECTDGLQEFGASIPEANQFRSEVQKLTHMLLAVADRKKEQ